MTLRVGLIGAGKVVSYGHWPAITALDDVELVALADVTEARRKIGQEWFQLPDHSVYSDYSEILKRDDIEAVCVAVPQAFRREIVLDAFSAGKHVLCEKPIAVTPAIAAELVQAARDAGLVFGIVHNYLFFPEYIKIKELLQAGVIGDLRVATLHFLGVIDYPGAAEYRDMWRHGMEAGGGVLTDMIHAVYLAEWLYDAPADQVMAFVDAPRYRARRPVVEDLALVQAAFPTGYAAIHMGWGEGVGGVDLSGSAGHLRMRYERYHTSGFNRPAELYTVDSAWNRQDHALDNLPEHMQNIARSFTRLWADFRDAIREKRQPVAPAEMGQRALELTLGAYLSAVTGCVVELPLNPASPVYQKGIDGLADVDVWPKSRTREAGLFGVL
ncbi:MAG: Gfo/Idh/MocA family oxidoreductase [Chloroflexota bacterium]|nr:MAG: gfo/Idh/MocA family oxidoreductase [Chloroflexota bacterium]